MNKRLFIALYGLLQVVVLGGVIIGVMQCFKSYYKYDIGRASLAQVASWFALLVASVYVFFSIPHEWQKAYATLFHEEDVAT